MATFSFGFVRNKTVKAVVFGTLVFMLVFGALLVPAGAQVAQAGTPGKCFFGGGYNNITDPNGNHNYVWFAVGTAYNGHSNWAVYPPPSNIYFKFMSYSTNGLPASSGLMKVYFRFRWLPYWVLPRPNTWMICAR